jgi:hypothetical protein
MGARDRLGTVIAAATANWRTGERCRLQHKHINLHGH